MTTRNARSALAAGSRSWATPLAMLLGLTGGLLFGEPVLALVERVWDRVLLPAFLEIQKSGIPFCG